MAEPKKKTSQSRKGMRRSHHALTTPSLDVCPNCKSPKLSHRICPTHTVKHAIMENITAKVRMSHGLTGRMKRTFID